MTLRKIPELDAVRVLVVEDDYLVAGSLRLVLSRFGCEVIGPTATCVDALDRVRDEPIDLAVLDIVLSDGSSEPVARELLALGKPLLFLTGFRDDGVLPDDLRSLPRLQKPVNSESLARALVGLLPSRA